jgi:hypothetical protein
VPVSSAIRRRWARRIEEGLFSPVDPGKFAWFRRIFLGKFLLFELLHVVDTPREATPLLWVQLGVIGACVAAAEARPNTWGRLGVAVLLVIKIAGIVDSFPYTVNHAFFDAALLLLLALGAPEGGAGVHPLRVVQVGILIVFFYSGVQKLVHGYYVGGQFLAIRTLYSEGDMGRRLRWALSFVSGMLRLPSPPTFMQPRPSFLADQEVDLPGWFCGALYIVSNGVWMAEVGLPIMAIRRAWRQKALAGLLALECLILIVSGEISFGVTVIACLLSFFGRSTGDQP